MKIIGVANLKGGVGKSTTSVNLAAGLAKAGKRVLLVDLDPQGNASTWTGYDTDEITEASPSMSLVMANGLPIKEAIVDTAYPNLKLAPADLSLAEVATNLNARPYRESVLSEALEGVEGFDYIVIDTQPTLDLLPQNALAAADRILIPTTISNGGFTGVVRVIKAMNKVKGKPADYDFRIVYTRVKGHDKELLDRTKANFESVSDRIFKTEIRETVTVEQSQEVTDEGPAVPVIMSGGSNNALKDYRSLVQEVLKAWPA